MIQYSILYCIVDVALLGLTLSIYFYITQDFGSEEETFRFKLLVGTLAVYLVSDLILGIVYSGVVRIGVYLNTVVVYTNIITLALIAFLWYRYALLRLSPELDENTWQQVLSSIPIIYVVILVSGSIFNGWAFVLVEGGGFEAGRWFLAAFAVGALYLVAISIMAVLWYVRSEGSLQRKRYVWLAFFLLPPIFAVLVEVFIPKTPVMGIGIYLAIHLVFFSYQSRRIHDDSLTGLNNRRRIDSYLESHIGSEEMGLFLFDVNCFKDVNDNFGHTEGDRALCDVAKAIRLSCANKQAIAARYGGDEFAVVATVQGDNAPEDPQDFIAEVRRNLDACVEERNPEYQLTVSAGYAHISKGTTNVKRVFDEADKALYEDKLVWHKRIGDMK